MKTLKLFSVVVAAGVLASPVLACGDGWMGMNLVATPDCTHVTPNAEPPARGLTNSGSSSRRRISPASAFAPRSWNACRGNVTDAGVRHVGKCKAIQELDIDAPLLSDKSAPYLANLGKLVKLWWLEHWRGRCYVEPSGS